MVCSADDFGVWKDFPKGLRVLLLDDDTESAAEIGAKLEAMDYIVSSYHNEKDAMEAILGKSESYHVAIVEVTTISVHGNFTFLQVAKDLPTIVISNAYCFNTMMDCIALGAAEFLQKPLSDDKLRNIWQHVVHKAFSAGGNSISKSLEPIEETASCTIRLQPDSKLPKILIPSCISDDKYPAPSTPQLSKRRRLEKNGDLDDQPECSDNDYAAEAKEVVEMPNFGISDAKSVDITCNNMAVAEHSDEAPASNPMDPVVKEKLDSTENSNLDDSTRSAENEAFEGEFPKRRKSFLHDTSCLNSFQGRRRKMKVDWTPELHKRFVRAVEQLGVDQAIPSKILELMKVEGLTRHNVASHLQKFRMHRRHILPKDDDKRWQVSREFQQKGYMQKPIMAFTPYHSSNSAPPNNAYTVWPHPSYHLPHVQIWGHSGMPTWHPPQGNWQWKTSSEVHADTWGYPVLPNYGYSHFYMPTQGPTMSCIGFDSLGDKAKLFEGFYDLCPDEEIINEVVKEAMSKPWLPLPLGLKPPSIDTVLAELHRKGIHSIPPLSHHQA